jgi:N-acetylglucosamine kinase-like BadF-type ATPase
MNERCFLGIDGGGTRTRAVLLGGKGREIARAESGPSNVHAVGQAQAQASLQQAAEQVLSRAGLAMDCLTAIGLGMAGAARPRDREIVETMVSHLLRPTPGAPAPRVIITHDAECALVGGTGRRYGVVLISGTGAMAYGVNARGEPCRADGWGHLLGDEGSAYWIGRELLRAVTRAHDGRGAPTTLQAALLSRLSLSDASGMVERVYTAGFGVPQVAGLAPLVSQAAASGDAVAREILCEAGRLLGNTVSAVVRGLGMSGEAFEVVLAGGVLRAERRVRDAVVAVLQQAAPRAQAIEPRHDAAFGAALLARQVGE